IYPSRRGMMPAVRTLLDFLSERLPPTYQRLEKQGAAAPVAQ
ncbi:MAG: LysR family transcriptional regulator, partial [Achromobacter sp.]|nr:LysR family transcriptional regulator [Achromobacter sp.]